MKRIFVSFLALVVVLLTACKSSNKNVDRFVDKVFSGDKGGSIVISIDKDSKEAKMIFSGATVIKPNTDPSKVDKDKVKKEKAREFKNPRIVKKLGGEYLEADDFEYKLKIIDDNTIEDVEDKNVYKGAPTK